MSIDMSLINNASIKIAQEKKSGMILEAHYMWPLPSVFSESWDAAFSLVEKDSLTSEQRTILMESLEFDVQKQMEFARFDDFDLVFERILQLKKNA